MPRLPHAPRHATFTGLLDHVRASGHRLCRCGAYHYPHRPTSGCCHQHEMSAARLAARYGVTGDALADIIAEVALTTPGRVSKRCPF